MPAPQYECPRGAVEPPEGGLESPSIVKTSQMLTISKERLEKRLGRLDPEKMESVDRAGLVSTLRCTQTWAHCNYL